jgi:sortase (surface protein transpeptidase)
MSRLAAVTVAAGLLAIAAGTVGLLSTRHSTPALRPPPLGVATVPAPAGPVVSSPPLTLRPLPGHSQSASAPGAAPVPVARPVSLTIPLIGVRTALVTLGLTADGVLEVPSSTAVAGWYTGSARPGAVGPAVIVGHVDSLSGPGVFFRLSELQPGDRVYVTRADGTMVEFRVTSVQTYLKAYFPTQAVYGGTPYPELRLITCGGTFDYATGHYLSNTIVYATESG